MDGISVKELLEKRSHLFGKHPVIAGRNGMDRLITNVNVMEVPDIYGQVRKGDLLLTTGYSIKDNILAQENLIFGLAERNITAIGIKLKRYIHILPEKMLEQADEFRIPIIDLSNEINFSLVISEVLEEILYYKSKGNEHAHVEEKYRDVFLRKWVLGEIIDKENILSQAAAAGLVLQEKYVLMIASFGKEIQNKEHILRNILLFASGLLVVPFAHQFTILIPENVFSKSSFSIPDLFKCLAPDKQNFVRLGIGSEKPIEHIAQAYKEAKESISVYSVMDPERVFCFYKELGIYTMLHRIANHEELIYPTLVILKPLFCDDIKNKNELLETLSCYVYQNGNIKETAGMVYCHYNSVLYRLERIESLLGISVRAPEQFFQVQFAIRLHDFIKKFQPHLLEKLFCNTN